MFDLLFDLYLAPGLYESPSSASSPPHQRFANFSPSRIRSSPCVDRERFQTISAAAPANPAALHSFQSEPETGAGNGETETGAAGPEYIPELFR